MLKTRITEMLGIQYPIVQGGMAWLAVAELVSAVSNAGGLGIIGSVSFSTPEELRQEIRKTRELTDKPFAVNITMLPAMREIPNDGFVQIAIEEGVKIFETSGSPPTDYIDAFKQAGAKVMHKVGRVRHARSAERMGCDAVIAVGFEGAGHPLMDDITLWNLIPRMADAVSIPVLAAGGSSDARQLVAALALGADAVFMGTRFMVTQESVAHPDFKQALVNATEMDTCMIQRSIQNQTRVLKNKAAEQVLAMELRGTTLEELVPFISGQRGRSALLTGHVNAGTMTCGQGVGLIHSIPTVKEVIEDMVNGAEALLQQMASGVHA
ncbi:MAG: nitronate monooxygenase [Chloroflexota bacterium]|nr:nitronate monooxygenase [Chloroflexota bacterium]